MAIRLDIGEAGGPQYNVARAIKSFLDQMAEGNIGIGAAVIKELMQNADDAGATELSVLLDERQAPKGLGTDFTRLLQPALLIRNNAPFKHEGESERGSRGDFSALCDVASGHKRAQSVSAGRFGIGFNSVYFFTDTPVIFSRREVHIFDPTHAIFEENGWKFQLDDFPSEASGAGPIKTVLDWALPKQALSSKQAFGEIAGSASDYGQAILRLPLRSSIEGAWALRPDCFPTLDDRQKLLTSMATQAARAILFLRSLESVEFGILKDDGVEILDRIEITPNPVEFREFVEQVKEDSKALEAGRHLRPGFFERTITNRKDEDSPQVWSFHVKHEARFDQDELTNLRAHLQQNEERAVPWVSIAIPINQESMSFDGQDVPAWRVFLPLLEESPFSCVCNGAFFVGPSRQRAEFREEGSDEAMRKTKWNKALIEYALVPLIRDASLEMTNLIPDLMKNHPQSYLNLFPVAATRGAEPVDISSFLQEVFAKEPWYLNCYDLWDDHTG